MLGKVAHNGWDFALKAAACGVLFNIGEQSGNSGEKGLHFLKQRRLLSFSLAGKESKSL